MSHLKNALSQALNLNNVPRKPCGDQEQSFTSMLMSRSGSSELGIKADKTSQVTLSSSALMDYDEQEACQMIGNERQEGEQVSKFQLMQKPLTTQRLQTKTEFIKQKDSSTLEEIKENIIETNSEEQFQKDQQEIYNTEQKLKLQEAQKKQLETLKKKSRQSQIPQQTSKEVKPFGYQGKATTISEGKGLRIGVTLLKKANQRKKTLLYPKQPKPTSLIPTGKPRQGCNKVPLMQKTYNIGELKQVTMQTSSLFNISIENIRANTPLKKTTDLSSIPHHDNNSSMNTTKLMAQLVNQAVQPSEKSSFQFTMKYFRPVGSNTNCPTIQQQDTHDLLIDDSFQKLESQINLDNEDYFDSTAYPINKGDGIEKGTPNHKILETPYSKQSQFNMSNTTVYGTTGGMYSTRVNDQQLSTQKIQNS